MINIEQAIEILKSGGIAAIPTETVYGLAANALDEKAVAKIFEAKGRPADNPLIVHISDIQDMEIYARNIPKIAYTLADKFWNYYYKPLTVILQKKEIIPNIVSGGLDTVALRIPNHPIAFEIIDKCGFPIAAPSANKSGYPSPTTAAHVIDDYGGKIPVVDGGECVFGLESTVISFDDDETIRVLRPGFVTVENLEIFGKVIVDKNVTEKHCNEKVISPGMKYRHYAPNADVILVHYDQDQELQTFILNNLDKYSCFIYASKDIFADLRDLDKKGVKKIFVGYNSISGVDLAIYNRLLRAGNFREIDLC